jgi:hypothetical protein
MTTEDMVVDVSQDWLQACSVQEHFMRGPALNNCWVNLSASCRQMRALGGDYYNFAFLGDGQIAMLVGDASGKGVAAALMMASVQASVRTAAQFTGDNLAGLFRAAKSGELTASSRLWRPAGWSQRMNSFVPSSLPWTLFPQASRQTTQRWPSCEPSNNKTISVAIAYPNPSSIPGPYRCFGRFLRVIDDHLFHP